MSPRVRDLLVLFLLALVARIVAVALVPWPPFTDPAYYAMIAERLAEGHGFTTPVLWSFIEVGSVIPDPATLPVPSNAHWMPLTSIVAAASMAVFGSTYIAATLPMVVLSALLVPFTYLVAAELFGSRWTAILAAALAVFAGPLFIMYPTTDNFAVFGATGAASLYCSMRAIRAPRPGWWLVAAGAFAGLATLSRIDGALLTVGVATAWFVRRGWTPWTPAAIDGATVGWGAASAAAYFAVLAPWLARNQAVFGALLPSAGGHTLWIREYNEQFSIGHEVSLSTYLDWGPIDIIGSKLYSWGELIGRTGLLLGGIFFIFFVAGLWLFRRRADLAPFLVYFVVMFVAMGAIFTFHAPKGAFYHSAPAWLPWAFAISAAAVAPACTAAGRWWPFLRRPATHRFIAVAGLAGAIALSVAQLGHPVRPMGPVPNPPRAGGDVPARERTSGRRVHGQRSGHHPSAHRPLRARRAVRPVRRDRGGRRRLRCGLGRRPPSRPGRDRSAQPLGRRGRRRQPGRPAELHAGRARVRG